jgi:hypothetical protein
MRTLKQFVALIRARVQIYEDESSIFIIGKNLRDCKLTSQEMVLFNRMPIPYLRKLLDSLCCQGSEFYGHYSHVHSYDIFFECTCCVEMSAVQEIL